MLPAPKARVGRANKKSTTSPSRTGYGVSPAIFANLVNGVACLFVLDTDCGVQEEEISESGG